MLENRDYMRRGPGGIEWSATLVLIAICVVVFLLQLTIIPGHFETRYLDLSAEGIKSGFVWQLLTFQFLHGRGSIVHIAFNCLALYMFGRAIESALGTKRFLALYLGSGIFGGMLHVFAAFVWPNYFDMPVVGASAGIFGVVAAFAMLFPDQPLLFFFIIKMRARTLLWIELVITALGISFPGSFGGNVAHTAHFGGMLAGLAFIRLHESGWSPFRWRRAKHPVFTTPFRVRSKPEAPAPKEEFISQEVDPILDKISAHGIQSLTERERQILERARNKMGKR